MIAFLIAAFSIVGSPGPATISAAGVAKGFGFWPAMRYQIGLLCGGSIPHVIMWAVVSGGIFTTLSLINPALITGAKLLLGLIATGLLLWVAWKIGTARGSLSVQEAQSAPGFFQGVALNLVNPKIYVGMFPLYYNEGFRFGWANQPVEFGFKFVAIFMLAFVSHTLWVTLGAVLGEVKMSERQTRAMNLGFGLMLVAVTLWALWMMLREFL